MKPIEIHRNHLLKWWDAESLATAPPNAPAAVLLLRNTLEGLEDEVFTAIFDHFKPLLSHFRLFSSHFSAILVHLRSFLELFWAAGAGVEAFAAFRGARGAPKVRGAGLLESRERLASRV